MNFAERNGIIPVRTLIQLDSIDLPLRRDLWEVVHIWMSFMEETHGNRIGLRVPSNNVFHKIWASSGGLSDEIPDFLGRMQSVIKNIIIKGEFHEVYELIEFIAEFEQTKYGVWNEIEEIFNSILERNLSAWRFVQCQLVPVSNEAEIESIETSLSNSKAAKGVNYHIDKSLSLLSNKEKIDTQNSIKESISAIESICRIITNNPKGTLGNMLNEMDKKNLSFPPKLLEGWKNLYHYASSEDGLRHAANDTPNSDLEMAKYFLVISSALANLLLSYCIKNNIDLTRISDK